MRKAATVWFTDCQLPPVRMNINEPCVPGKQSSRITSKHVDLRTAGSNRLSPLKAVPAVPPVCSKDRSKILT